MKKSIFTKKGIDEFWFHMSRVITMADRRFTLGSTKKIRSPIVLDGPASIERERERDASDRD